MIGEEGKVFHAKEIAQTSTWRNEKVEGNTDE
jgi:hypothetical protein